MTFFTHPEPGPLRELQTDWVLPPERCGTPCFGAKTKVTGAPWLITDIPTVHLTWLNVSLSNSQQLWLLYFLQAWGEREKDSSTFTEPDISNAEEFIQTLKPIKVATCAMGAETHPTLSIKAPLHAQFLRATRETLRNSSFIVRLKEAIHHTYNPWFTPDPLKYDFAASVFHLAPSGCSYWMRSKA